MESKNYIEVINGIVIKDGNLLVVKKKDVWILPGRKLGKESHIECLCREFSEEFSGTKIDKNNIIPYKNFKGIYPHSKKFIIAKTSFLKLNGELGEPSMQINDSAYIPLFSEYNKYISEITREIMISLRKDGYLNLF